MTHLDQRFCGFQEILLAMRLGSFLIPVNYGLVGNAVLVVQCLRKPTACHEKKKRNESPRDKINSYLYYLRKGFHSPAILITVHLDGVDERHLRLWVITEGLENIRKFLRARGDVKLSTGEICDQREERISAPSPPLRSALRADQGARSIRWSLSDPSKCTV